MQRTDGNNSKYMFNPLVDVLTITYNQEGYISQCIESVLSQTYENWRMYIVDDGSEDDTFEIIKSYGDSRIVPLSMPHRGIENLKKSYDLALQQGDGELLAILDGDDWWPPNKLEIEVPVFQNPEVVMSFGNVDIFDDKNRFVECASLPRFASGLQEGNSIIFKMLFSGFFPYSVSTMLRRSSLNVLGGFVQPADLPLVDMPTWLNLIKGGKCMGISEALGCYRVHSASVCRRRSLAVSFGQMKYNEIYLDSSWSSIGLTEEQWDESRKQLIAYNSHRRGVLCLNEQKWNEGLLHFRMSLSNGNLPRILKTGIRCVELVLKMVFYSIVKLVDKK